MNTEIIQLTTDIAALQKKHEEMTIEKVTIKSKEEEDNASQNKKVSELSRVIMALNNLEKIFVDRSQKGSILKYNYKTIKDIKKDEKLDEYNLNNTTLEVALAQLEIIKVYMSQYKKVIKEYNEKKKEGMLW